MLGNTGDQRWLSSTPFLEELQVVQEREAEACCAIIKKIESVPEAKGGTEKGLLESKTGFQEEAALEKKVEV